MFDLYRQHRATVQQQRREFGQAMWALRRAEPWRFVTLPISLVLALFLEWALEGNGTHSLTFWGLTAVGAGAVLLGSVRLSLSVRARWEHRQRREENV